MMKQAHGMGLRIMSRGWNEKKKKTNGGERSCFRILFASDAGAGTQIDDSNGFPFTRAAII